MIILHYTLTQHNMSAVIAIRNAIDMLQVSDLEHLPDLRDAFKLRESVLRTEHKKAEKLRKQSDTKRLTIVKKIQKIEPSLLRLRLRLLKTPSIRKNATLLSKNSLISSPLRNVLMI